MGLVNQLVCKEGNSETLPAFGIGSVSTFLLMPGVNPDPINKIAAKVIPEELVSFRGLQIPKGIWIDSQLTDEQKKMRGIYFQGVWCSLCKEDQWGLSSIRHLLLAGMPVNYEFVNGSILALNSSNMQAFEAAWVPARNSFFQ